MFIMAEVTKRPKKMLLERADEQQDHLLCYNHMIFFLW